MESVGGGGGRGVDLRKGGREGGSGGRELGRWRWEKV